MKTSIYNSKLSVFSISIILFISSISASHAQSIFDIFRSKELIPSQQQAIKCTKEYFLRPEMNKYRTNDLGDRKIYSVNVGCDGNATTPIDGYIAQKKILLTRAQLYTLKVEADKLDGDSFSLGNKFVSWIVSVISNISK